MKEEEKYLFIKERYIKKFGTDADFDKYYEAYQSIPSFKANQNFYEISTDYSDRNSLNDTENQFINNEKTIRPEIHWIMRMATQYYLTLAFKAMKIDIDDPNITEQALGKGTPGRIAKMWCGNDPEDTTELGSGRWNKEPFISTFPNTGEDDIITKEVDLISNCSHHFLPFSSLDGGKAIISYKPKKYVLGISKLQRYVTWAARRFWLQEDLTKYLGDTIKRIADTEDVYIRLEKIVHGCEKFRGANARNGSLTTEYKSGIFKKLKKENKNYDY